MNRGFLFFIILILAFLMSYDFIADRVQEVIAGNNGTTWAPVAQKIFAATSYGLRKNRVAREAYALQIKLFPNETDQAKALYRIAKASERMNDYRTAAKFYKKLVEEFPNHALAGTSKARLADIESVYLEFVS